jgi:phage I-like protein
MKPNLLNAENVQPAELNQGRLLVATVHYLDALGSQKSIRILGALLVFCNAVALGVLIRHLAVVAY